MHVFRRADVSSVQLSSTFDISAVPEDDDDANKELYIKVSIAQPPPTHERHPRFFVHPQVSDPEAQGEGVRPRASSSAEEICRVEEEAL